MSSSKVNRNFNTFLIGGIFLLLGIILLGSAPRAASAGGQKPGRRYPPASPTPPLHLLWQYNVLVALNPVSCSAGNEGLVINGSGNTAINGGGVLAYGCLKGNGNAGSVEIEPPFKPLGRSLSPGSLTWNPQPEYYRDLIDLQMDFTDQAEQACAELPRERLSNSKSTGEKIITPGNYPSIIVTDTLTMLPGLYCLTGDFTVNNGAVLTGDGVTIYMTGGDFEVADGAEVHLAAPAEGVIPDLLWQDILLYVANDHAATVTIFGAAISNYHGVLYVPASNIELTGGGEFHLQVVGWNVEVGGQSDLTLMVDFWPGLPKIKVGSD